MIGVDLQSEIAAKIEKNAARVYHRLSSGVLVKSETMASAEVQPHQQMRCAGRGQVDNDPVPVVLES